MSAITEEIQKLQSRILELETQKKKKDEIDKKTSLDHNFNVMDEFIKVVLTKKKEQNDYYIKRLSPRSTPDDINGDEVRYNVKFIANMESIYNILQILDKRLNKIEEYIGPNIKKE